MRWRAAETPGATGLDRVAVDLRTRYAVDDDGVFETPDELDSRVEQRLRDAGHTPVDELDGDADAATDGDVEQAADEATGEAEDDETPDDEYAEMDRSELYEVYKDRGGPASWNDTSEESLREALRVHDEHGTFPTIEEE